MTEPHSNQLEDPDPAATPPQTGHPAIDQALLGVADLASAPLAEHHDRLAKAHEVLREALDRGDDNPPDDAQRG